MIRFRLTELLADRGFKAGRRIELQEVAEGSGVHRTTLSRMVNIRGYNLTVNNLDCLCKFFGCQLGELAEYVPDDEVENDVGKASQAVRTSGNRATTKAPRLKNTPKKK